MNIAHNRSKYITLYEKGGYITYTMGKHGSNVFADRTKVIQPPERGRDGQDMKYGECSYTAIDMAWWQSLDADEWLLSTAHEWREEIGAHTVVRGFEEWKNADTRLPNSKHFPDLDFDTP